jgi:magnesium chelatase family protein
MALAVLKSRALAGMAAPEVTVEVHLAVGLPSFTLVGLPDTEVKEARDRVRAAIQNAHFDFPARRITVNLAPADLPIALGILIASGQVKAADLDRHEFAGELSLSGELRPIRGALAMCLAAAGNGRSFVLPRQSAAEAALIEGLSVLPAASLLEVCAHLGGQAPLQEITVAPAPTFSTCPDLAEVKGQAQSKRALEVAAAGGHSLLMSGPPGSGKSMLASRLTGILPPMTRDEALGSAAVLSLAGLFDPARWAQRPYRAPHHSSSAHWSVAAACRAPARSRWRTTACSSSTSCPNSSAACWRLCASRSKPAISTSPAPRAAPSFRRASSWSRR